MSHIVYYYSVLSSVLSSISFLFLLSGVVASAVVISSVVSTAIVATAIVSGYFVQRITVVCLGYIVPSLTAVVVVVASGVFGRRAKSVDAGSIVRRSIVASRSTAIVDDWLIAGRQRVLAVVRICRLTCVWWFVGTKV